MGVQSGQSMKRSFRMSVPSVGAKMLYIGHSRSLWGIVKQ
jgi:hypothetical protein